MLAKETMEVFDSDEWLFEIKWDGYRAVGEIKAGNASLYSRNGISFNNKYPLICKELEKIKHDVVLDGEIVVLDEKGQPSFQKLQHYEDNTQFPLCYYVFDILSLDRKDTCELPLIERKELLLKLIGRKNATIKYSDHIHDKGKAFFTLTGKQGLEGIMAKKKDSEYFKGTRSSYWLKIKHHQSDEAIIVGFTKPTGARKYFGALVLATMGKNGLQYAGHTGSGFDQKKLQEVYEMLQPLQTSVSPFKEKVKTNMPVTWVQAKYVCEIKFTEWTEDGKMRHPVFLRMREDKSKKDVTMAKSISKKTAAPAEKPGKDGETLIGKVKVKTTNRDKIYWPKEKITKGMMINYYQSIADYILPYLKDRPESLKRNPGGIADKGFYHKDAGEDTPAFVKSIPIFSESSNKNIDYIICNNKATLAYMNNLGCIEINPWHSTIKSPDKPDYVIIDIDPSSKNNYDQVVETALVIKKILDKAGAIGFCKTSGATGMHIYIPLQKKYTYQQARDFAEIVCTLANEQLPFASMERNLKKRGNKLYLDHLQNSRGQTIAAAYSLRPFPGATVSTPLEWKEVKSGLKPSEFTIFSVPERLKKTGDLFSGVLGKGIDLKRCLEKLAAG
ncbi:MAG TPA: DNA ligase D [Ferruginibacter sp.]|nr:DNA ligase D [Ferruginibacter sp.]